MSYAAALLEAGGFAPLHAQATARVLVWANARGTDSHGVLRIPRYVEMVAEGKIAPQAQPELVFEEGAVALIEAANAPGAVAMGMGMSQAMAIARRAGIGWCSVRNISHAGAIGFFAEQAAAEGYLGIAMTASGPLMAYHGSRVAGVSTNPLAISVPNGRDAPLLLDMSTSTVALGKIFQARDTGRSLPEGWAIDAQGRPATDPAKVATLTPMSGPKGSGLSLMIEVLCSVLVGNPVISEALAGRKAAMNGAALALKIPALCDPERFAADIQALVGQLKGLPPAEGVEDIRMPGERGYSVARERDATGIPLSAGTLGRLTELGKALKVREPLPI